MNHSATRKRKSRLNRIIVLAAFAIILHGLFDHLLSSESGLSEQLKPGSRLPDFSLRLADGHDVSRNDFAGKPAVYFFFANWCPCAHLSVGFVKRLSAENKEKLSVCGVGIQDGAANLEKFARKHDLKFPIGVYGGDDMADSLGIRTTPALVFVDADGIIRSYFLGKVEMYEQIEKGLDSVMGAKAA